VVRFLQTQMPQVK